MINSQGKSNRKWEIQRTIIFFFPLANVIQFWTYRKEMNRRDAEDQPGPPLMRRGRGARNDAEDRGGGFQ